jgi:hypothetical protein
MGPWRFVAFPGFKIETWGTRFLGWDRNMIGETWATRRLPNPKILSSASIVKSGHATHGDYLRHCH